MRTARRIVALTAAAATLTAGGVATGALVGVASAQTVLSVSPKAAGDTGTTTLTISGSGFSALQDSVSLVPDPKDGPTGTGVASIAGTVNMTATTSTSLVASFDLTLAAPGNYDVSVTEQGATTTTATLADGFTITAPSAPTATGSARDGATGRGDGKLIISGSGFAKGAKVDFLKPGGTIDPALSFVVENGTASGYVSAKQIDGTYTAGAAVTPGQHQLRVTNTDGQSGGTSEFWQPVFTTVSPKQLGQGASKAVVTVTGQGIRQGSTLGIASSGTSGDVTVGTSTVSADGTTISAPVTVTSAGTAGARAVTVRGPDGGFQTNAGLFTVTAAPTITSSSVTAIGQGAQMVSTTITGTGFQDGATFDVGGNGLTVLSSTYVSATSYTLVLSATSTATTGDRTVTVTNPDGGSGSKSAGTFPSTAAAPITVDAGPTITSTTNAASSPASGAPSTSSTVQITGTGFDTAGATVTVSGAGVTVTGTTVASATSITATFTIAAGAASGNRDVTVVNTADKGQSTLVGGFGVNSLTVTPNAGANTGPKTLTAKSTSTTTVFSSSATVALHKSGGLADQPDIAGTAVAPAGSSVAATFDLTSAATGSYDVVVTDGASTYSCTGCFTVTGGAQTVTAIAPATAGQGAKGRVVTITGTGFSRGESVTIAGTTVSAVTFVSSTSLTASVAVPGGAATGAQDVVVTEADGTGAATLTGGFTVTEAPTPSAVTPASRGAGAQNQTLTITGKGLVAGTTLDLGPGITVVSSKVTDGGSNAITGAENNDTLTAVVSITPGTATGAHDLVLTNPDGGTATLAKAFTVNAGPVPTAISPATLGAGSTQSVTITGTGFATNAVPTATDLTFSAVMVSSDGTSLTATAAVAAGAARGTRDLVVTNPTDMGTGTATGLVTIATVPGAVSNLAVSTTATSATLTWAAPTNDGGSPVSSYTASVSGTSSVQPVTVDAKTFTATLSGLTTGQTYTLQVVATNAVGSGTAAAISATPAAAAPAAPAGSRFTPLTPVRLLDTRSGLGARKGVVPSTGYVDVTVAGVDGVPADAVAVVLNVTAVGASGVTNIRVYPTPASGNTAPTVSNLNLVKGQTRADLVTVKVGSGGKVRLYSAGGSVDLLADLAGSYAAAGTSPDGSSAYHPVTPVRLLDTRTTSAKTIGSRATRDLKIAGTAGVPTDATSVVLGVTAASATATTNVRTYPVPTDGSVPTVSTLNLGKADGAVPNLAVVKLGQGGAVRFFNSAGATSLLVDLYGYYDASGTGGQVFHPLDPERYLDTRTDSGPLGPQDSGDLEIASADGAVPTSATAAVLTVTGVKASTTTNIRVYPTTDSDAVPTVSSLNLLKGTTSADAAVVGLGGGDVTIFNAAGTVDVLVDVAGWFGPAASQ